MVFPRKSQARRVMMNDFDKLAESVLDAVNVINNQIFELIGDIPGANYYLEYINDTRYCYVRFLGTTIWDSAADMREDDESIEDYLRLTSFNLLTELIPIKEIMGVRG